MIIKRVLETAIRLYRSKYPVIALTGPRQSGKTTLLKTLFSDYEYVSLENPDTRSFAETDPNGFLARYSEKVIFDEVQRVPALFSYIQTRVDEAPVMGRYILSGSQNFHLMQSITQSLAGRVAIFRLFPFDSQELNTAGLLADNYLEMIVRGFYPAIYDREIPSRVFYSNYVQTYIQRDISELVAIKDTRLFQNFLGLCAARAGQLLNLNSLANECGISQPTAKSWLSVLETSYIVFQLHPFHRNFNKRIVKTPKIYFYDTGLLCHLLKISSPDQLLAHPIKGNLFENMMVAEYLKRINHENRFEDIWFWRDSAGHEIDLLIQDGQVTRLAEMKAGLTVMPDMFETLAWWEKISEQQNLVKMLVYGGNENQSRSAGAVVSWRDFGK
jgi:predicted AAA+ superfamily ATPase